MGPQLADHQVYAGSAVRGRGGGACGRLRPSAIAVTRARIGLALIHKGRQPPPTVRKA